MTALRELGLAGNSLGSLPESVGSLAALTKLQLHGNQLAAVPPSVSGLQALEELWLQASGWEALAEGTDSHCLEAPAKGAGCPEADKAGHRHTQLGA